MSIRSSEVHVFDNGIRVLKRHLIDKQIERYKVRNLHEPEEESILNSILDELPSDNGVFVDVGAAVGYYLFLVALKKPKFKLYAFEPLKTHRTYLKENMGLNSIDKNNVILCSEALYDRIGVVSFRKQLYGSKVLDKSAGLLSFLRNDRVKSITLDRFLHRERLDVIDIMKIDVQGGETNVLDGGVAAFRAKRVKCVIVGTHSLPKHEIVRNFFKSTGYNIAIDIPESATQPDGILVARC